MSKKSLQGKAEFIVDMCKNIANIVKRHGGITPALEDYEGQMAILMGIAQIGETLKKLDDDVVAEYGLKEDKEGAYFTRNYIVHDYEGVDLAFIDNIVRHHLPELEKKIIALSQSLNAD